MSFRFSFYDADAKLAKFFQHSRIHCVSKNGVDCELVCTGWLRIKYPTRQYAISLQPVV